jgi:hypothetical protein
VTAAANALFNCYFGRLETRFDGRASRDLDRWGLSRVGVEAEVTDKSLRGLRKPR